MSSLHPAAQAVLISIGAIGVAGLLWALGLALVALRQAIRARQQQVDWVLWEDEVNPFERFRIDDSPRGRTSELHRYIAEDAAYKRYLDGLED